MRIPKLRKGSPFPCFLDRPIEGVWPYLWIDATHVKVRQNGRTVSRVTVPKLRYQFT